MSALMALLLKEVEDLVASVRDPVGSSGQGAPARLGPLRKARVHKPPRVAGGGISLRPPVILICDDFHLWLSFLVPLVVLFLLFMASIHLDLHALFAGLIIDAAQPVLWFFGAVTYLLDVARAPRRCRLRYSERGHRLTALGVDVTLRAASRAVFFVRLGWRRRREARSPAARFVDSNDPRARLGSEWSRVTLVAVYLLVVVPSWAVRRRGGGATSAGRVAPGVEPAFFGVAATLVPGGAALPAGGADPRAR